MRSYYVRLSCHDQTIIATKLRDESSGSLRDDAPTHGHTRGTRRI
jgi:hypothetical protein